MLLWLTHLLAGYYRSFYVFQYLSLRAIVASLTALLVSLLLGPVVIRTLNQYQLTQPIRGDGPKNHLSKIGTPTMGGGLILLAIVLTLLLWANLHNRYIWVVLLALVGFGAIGFLDDYYKLALKTDRGLTACWKYLWQSCVGLMIAFILYATVQSPLETQLIVPFFKTVALELGVFFIPWVYLVVVGYSNAVNLTDGLDGLAILPAVLVGGGLGVFAYLTGNMTFANYLAIPFIPGAGEMVVACAAIVGAGLGFLWFNTYPAQVFMGDIGALSLGAALGTIAVVVRQELVLSIMGGIFVLETASVVLQVLSFKLTGKRIFRMAPIHHHFELKGWPEPRIIVRFWIITVVLVLCGLATLKLR